MAKIKLDWFKLDCQLDEKVELIESEFGLLGFAVVVKLWQWIYGINGYYCDWNDDVALVFAKKNNVGATAVSEIVARCIKRGIFDEGMFKKSGILTSHGIQQRYYECAERRKGEKIKPEYLLLCNTQKNKNADNSSKNAYISNKNAYISDTEENRREKKRRDKNRKTEALDFSVVHLTDQEREELVRLSDSLSVDRYIHNLSIWQQEHQVFSKKAFMVIKGFIEDDKAKKSSKTSKNSDASYDIEKWEKFAESYVPNFIKGGKKD